MRFKNTNSFVKKPADEINDAGYRQMEGSGFANYITIYESELRFMAGLAVLWGEIETGGDQYGLWTHSERAVILLASPPGPKAIHSTTQFIQDVEFFQKTTRLIDYNFGFQYIGGWHSHHSLGLDKPSGGDCKRIRSLAQRNRLHHLIDFVLTFEKNSDSPIIASTAKLSSGRKSGMFPGFSPGRNFPVSRECKWDAILPHKNFWVRVNAFYYTDAPNGTYLRCPLRVLPCESPIRREAFKTGIFPCDKKQYLAGQFPLDRIVYDRAESEKKSVDSRAIPTELNKQIRYFPNEIRDGIQTFVERHRLIFQLPVASGYSIDIEYVDQPPYQVSAIHFHHPWGQLEFPFALFSPATDARMSKIFERIVKILGLDQLQKPSSAKIPFQIIGGEESKEYQKSQK